MEMLMVNGEIMILNCTYKINAYSMPLAVLTGTTCLNSSFYSGFVFLKDEKLSSYQWLIGTVKLLYQHLDIPLPIVWLSDGEANIPPAIASEITPTADHALCVWHLLKNVLDNCKKHFDTQEA